VLRRRPPPQQIKTKMPPKPPQQIKQNKISKSFQHFQILSFVFRCLLILSCFFEELEIFGPRQTIPSSCDILLQIHLFSALCDSWGYVRRDVRRYVRTYVRTYACTCVCTYVRTQVRTTYVRNGVSEKIQLVAFSQFQSDVYLPQKHFRLTCRLDQHAFQTIPDIRCSEADLFFRICFELDKIDLFSVFLVGF
jgi:hypothetical protein